MLSSADAAPGIVAAQVVTDSAVELSFIAEQDRRRSRVISRTGGWKPGHGVYCHGYSMLDELVGQASYFQILILNATGRLVERPVADWVEAIFSCLSWPDPRIWCNQIGALAATARASNLAGTVMGCLATDSRTYGVLPMLEGMAFIQAALAQEAVGVLVSDMVAEAAAQHRGKPKIVGYIRPIAKGDERIEAMERVSRNLGLVPGPHLRLAYAIERELLQKFGESMNINGYASAVLSDLGFTADEVYRFSPTLVAAGVIACYSDIRSQPAESFLPLRCEDIDYQGAAQRPVPD